MYEQESQSMRRDHIKLPRGDGEAICPAELSIQGVRKAVENIWVISEAVLIDESSADQSVLFCMLVLA